MSAMVIALGILVAVIGLCMIALVAANRCSHEMYPTLHQNSGRIYYACRCGRRFQR